MNHPHRFRGVKEMVGVAVDHFADAGKMAGIIWDKRRRDLLPAEA